MLANVSSISTLGMVKATGRAHFCVMGNMNTLLETGCIYLKFKVCKEPYYALRRDDGVDYSLPSVKFFEDDTDDDNAIY